MKTNYLTKILASFIIIFTASLVFTLPVEAQRRPWRNGPIFGGGCGPGGCPTSQPPTCSGSNCAQPPTVVPGNPPSLPPTVQPPQPPQPPTDPRCPAGKKWGIVGYKTTYQKQCTPSGCQMIPVQTPVYGCVIDPNAPTPPTTPETPTTPTPPGGGSCSVDYSCLYSDGSIGTGTLTCSPGTVSMSGHMGTLNCSTCTFTPSSNCKNNATPPTVNPGDSTNIQ